MKEIVLGVFEELRQLGEAYFGLIRAEWLVLQDRLKRTAIGASKAAGLGAAALYLVLLCLPALLLFAAVDVLSSQLEWPYWLSALVVAAVVLLVIVVLLAMARKIWQSEVENPAISVRRRLDDHRNWWHQRLMYERRDSGLDGIGAGEFDDEFGE